METHSLDSFHEQLAVWAPRVVYGLVVAWMAYGLVTAGSMMTLDRLPS